jgi:hypothetical protein
VLVFPIRFAALAASMSVVLVGTTSAATLPQTLRFGVLHGAVELDTGPSVRGVQIEGAEMVFRDGHLTVSADQALLDDGTKAEEIFAGTVLELGDDFFQAPVTAVVNAFLSSSNTHIVRAEMQWSEEPGESPVEGVEESMAVKDILVTMDGGEFELSARSIVSISSKGVGSWDPQSQVVTIEVESVKAAGLPVPLTLAFGLMSKFIDVDFVQLDKPFIRLDVGDLLK